jgi:hypothetical protein
MKNSLFELDLGIEREYLPLLNDIIRMVTIQIITQLMFSLASPESFPFLTNLFFETILYMMAGISVYWLVVRKTVALV